MSAEHDHTHADGPGTESPGQPASERPDPRAADAAKAYATAEAQAGAGAAAAAGDPGHAQQAGQGNGDPAPATAEAPPSADPAPGADAPAEPAQTHEDHERQLERDLEELTAKAEKADEYLELAKRTKADFENYRKRATRDAAAAQERGITRLAKELLPAIDNLDRAVQAAEATYADGAEQANGHATLVSGVKLVHADVLAALQRAGIERYSPKGEPFDPNRHEAIAQQPVDGAQPGTIVEVYQQGYLLGEAVIRPARVIVAG